MKCAALATKQELRILGFGSHRKILGGDLELTGQGAGMPDTTCSLNERNPR